jgi:hypothetical protein
MKAWGTYFGILAICCIICPPLIGIGLGIGAFCLVWWVLYKAVGG